ncbi:hypothetical protein DUNSADRAFT_18496 [Dunaliella salina]|uniref:Uncharacterized protein n=1 Tax=Dunaliella salina TaxID=3046 RepID=A0ABQ7GZ33_DUNSA|nr:hypothetical protein DUNSADRAFT_18496 [Dunaliella salina]|eukprot:KAF5839834.1 hypothetical protein DUNSADRAFT_18496 [Dunaliella salina]
MHKAWKQLQQALAVGGKQQQQSKGDRRNSSSSSRSSSSSSATTRSSSNAGQLSSTQLRGSVQDTIGASPPGSTSQKDLPTLGKAPLPSPEEGSDTYTAFMGVPADLHSLPFEHRLGGKLDSSNQKNMRDTSTSSRMTCSTHFTNDSSTSSRLISVDGSNSSKYSYCGLSSSSSSQPPSSKALCTPQDGHRDSRTAPAVQTLPTSASADVQGSTTSNFSAPEQQQSCEHSSKPEHTGGGDSSISSLQHQGATPTAFKQPRPAQPAPISPCLPIAQQLEQQHLQPYAPPSPIPAFPLARGVSLPDAAELQATHPTSFSPIAASAFGGNPPASSLASISCSAGTGCADPVLKMQDARNQAAVACIAPTAYLGASTVPGMAAEDSRQCDKQAGFPLVRVSVCASSGNPSHASTPNPIPLLTPMLASQQFLLSSSQNSISGSIPVSSSLTTTLSLHAKAVPDEHPALPSTTAATAAAATAADDGEVDNDIATVYPTGTAGPAATQVSEDKVATKHASPVSPFGKAMLTVTPSAQQQQQQQQQQQTLPRPPAQAPLGKSTLSIGLISQVARAPNLAAPGHKPSRMQTLHHPKPAPLTSGSQFLPPPPSSAPPADTISQPGILDGKPSCEVVGRLNKNCQQQVQTTPECLIGANPEGPSSWSLQLKSAAALQGGSQPEVLDAQVLGSGDLPMDLQKYLQALRSEQPSQPKHLLLSRVKLRTPELLTISAFISTTQVSPPCPLLFVWSLFTV